MIMSILNKLRELVSAMESGDTKEEEVNIEDIISQISESQVDSEEIEEEPEIPDYIECTQDETASVLDIMASVKKSRLGLSELLLQFEKRKSQLMREIAKKEDAFMQRLVELKGIHGIPEDQQYSVTIPSVDEPGVIVFEKE
tara:strand:+ start:3385 stop:3810 length:426 start_codon:yes stop_codon:yes gene_type:complete